jgi:membrane protein
MPWSLSVLAFSLIYIVVPNCYVPWRAGVFGAVVAATLFEIAKFGFTWFVSNLSSYQLIYGAFAAIPLFLLWIHISWLITLFGVEWVKGLVTWNAIQHASNESVFYQSLRVLAFLWRNHSEGHATSAESLGQFLSELGCDHWSEIRQFLLQERLIAVDAQGNFLIGRDFHQVQISELMRNAPWTLSEWKEHISHHSSNDWQLTLANQWQQLEETLDQQFPQTLQQLLTLLSSGKDQNKKHPLE